MQVVWFLAWIPGMEQGIITGLAAGLAAYSRRRRSVLRTRTPSLVSDSGV
jgi:hypothetical protein